jgi:release factor glutamine methyltransferase
LITAGSNPAATLLDVRTVLKEAMARLRAAEVPSHTLTAELLLMHALGCDRAWLYTHPENLLDPPTIERYFQLVARRTSGEPTQYLTGKQEFWGFEFEVTPAVLIPRPETEHLVEVTLDRLGRRGHKTGPGAKDSRTPLCIADVGTGSGCLAVALAHELQQADVLATDISDAALEVARRNAIRHGVADRIHFLQGDLLEACHPGSRGFDLIVSNPPYIARSEANSLPREVLDHEPPAAFFSGPTGIEIYARLTEQARSRLRSGGILVLELGYSCAESVRAILATQPRWTNVRITNDLAGIPRVLAVEHS